MGRGSSKAGGGGGGGNIGTHGIPERPDVMTAGSINFNSMMAIRNSSINDASIALTGATVSVIPKAGGGGSVSRNNLADYLNDKGINRVVVQENRNSPQSTQGLQKLLAAGWQIQADCVNSDQTSGNYYFLVKPSSNTKPKTKTSGTKKTTTSKKYTAKDVQGMTRAKLESAALKAFVRINTAAGLTAAEATRRAKALMSGNTTAQLRKYVQKNGLKG